MNLADILRRPSIDPKELKAAKAIAEMGQSEGWQYFKEAAEALIQVMTPDVSEFEGGDAERIASRMAHVSGIKRCLGIMEHQKSIIQTGKKPDNN